MLLAPLCDGDVSAAALDGECPSGNAPTRRARQRALRMMRSRAGSRVIFSERPFRGRVSNQYCLAFMGAWEGSCLSLIRSTTRQRSTLMSIQCRSPPSGDVDNLVDRMHRARGNAGATVDAAASGIDVRPLVVGVEARHRTHRHAIGEAPKVTVIRHDMGHENLSRCSCLSSPLAWSRA